MILTRDEVRATPSSAAPDELLPGDSGSWAISID